MRENRPDELDRPEKVVRREDPRRHQPSLEFGPRISRRRTKASIAVLLYLAFVLVLNCGTRQRIWEQEEEV